MITVLGLAICVAILAFAAGAAFGWTGGWIAGLHGWLARQVRQGDGPPSSPPTTKKD